jgi:Bacterial PH domain
VRDRHSTDREVLRLTGPVVFWWVWLAFVTANVVDYAVQGLPSARFGAVVSAILLLVTGLVYTLALRPRVIVSAAGLTVVNPYRTHRVPWRLIHSVDTAEWVQVHYAPDAPDAAAGDGTSGETSWAASRSSAGDKTLHCWALYVSTRARHKINQANNRLGGGAFVASRATRAAESVGYRASSGGGALSDEARYLASLPVAKAFAVRLDTRAARERGRAVNGSGEPAKMAATAAWAWPALAAVSIPALILLIAAVA